MVRDPRDPDSMMGIEGERRSLNRRNVSRPASSSQLSNTTKGRVLTLAKRLDGLPSLMHELRGLMIRGLYTQIVGFVDCSSGISVSFLPALVLLSPRLVPLEARQQHPSTRSSAYRSLSIAARRKSFPLHRLHYPYSSRKLPRNFSRQATDRPPYEHLFRIPPRALPR